VRPIEKRLDVVKHVVRYQIYVALGIGVLLTELYRFTPTPINLSNKFHSLHQHDNNYPGDREHDSTDRIRNGVPESRN